MDIKENVKNTDVWLRGLFIVLFAAILYVAFILVWLLVVFQFVSKLLTRELNPQVASFSSGLLRYISQVLGYITFQSDERPFPFSPWPAGDKPATTTKPATRRRTSRSPARKKEDG